MVDNKKCEADQEKLLEIWKVLEMLTVSMDRLGTFEIFNGKEASKEVIHKFMGPNVNKKIAHARSLMVDILTNCDPAMYDKLEALSENESDIGYWKGPKKSNQE